MRHSVVDLSAFPAPDAIDPLDYETALAARKAAFLRSFDARNPTPQERAEMVRMLEYEYEPIVALLEQDAYLDTLQAARINDKVRAVLLASAYDKTLDHIAATYYRATRRVIAPADPAAGVDAVMEDDETFRARTALSPESWSCAGPEGAYLYFGMSASSDVLDLAVYSEDEGVCLAPTIRVAVLSRRDLEDVRDTLDAVRAALNRREIRPYGDKVIVEAVPRLPYRVALTLLARPGSSHDVIAAAARAKVEAYTSGLLRWIGDGETGPVWLVGRRIRTGTLAAAGRVEGVEEVIVREPVADVNAPAPGYDAALPLPLNAVAALDPALTTHLFRAPVCVEIEVLVETLAEGWTS